MVHSVVVGLGFGDEGKGRIVDYLCAEAPKQAVIRFSGGAQAAHNVVTPDGRHHTFAQFGSGTFHGVPTYLSEYMKVNPLNLMREAAALAEKVDGNPLDNLFVSSKAVVTTPYHRMANRWREMERGDGRHGSCGQGIGETEMLRLEGVSMTVGDMWSEKRCYDGLERIQSRYIREFGSIVKDEGPKLWDLMVDFKDIYKQLQVDWSGTLLEGLLDDGDCVLEGSQGVLLDEWYGFHPYTTWSTTTPENALKILGERESRTIGVTRSYQTRHGAGPMPTEQAYGLDEKYPEEHNGTGVYQGAWRRGYLDLVLLRYASDVVVDLDEIAVTHLDRPLTPVVTRHNGVGMIPTKHFYFHKKTDLRYQEDITSWLQRQMLAGSFEATMPRDIDHLCQMITEVTAAPVTIQAFGPTWEATRVLQMS